MLSEQVILLLLWIQNHDFAVVPQDIKLYSKELIDKLEYQLQCSKYRNDKDTVKILWQIELRLKLYKEDNDPIWLLDVANLAVVLFRNHERWTRSDFSNENT